MSSLVDLANKISNCTTSECAKDEGIRIYTKLECVPSGKRVITDIESFFNRVRLRDDELTREILSTVENAEFLDCETFKDRFGRRLFINSLSTGAKGLLCIYYYPEYVFDIRELGVNCRSILSLFPTGNILVNNPNFMLSDYNNNALKCFINNKFFCSFSEANLELGGLDDNDI